MVLGGGGGGGHSTDVRAGRCGWGAQNLTLFKTEIFDFGPPFKTGISSELNRSQRQLKKMVKQIPVFVSTFFFIN